MGVTLDAIEPEVRPDDMTGRGTEMEGGGQLIDLAVDLPGNPRPAR